MLRAKTLITPITHGCLLKIKKPIQPLLINMNKLKEDSNSSVIKINLALFATWEVYNRTPLLKNLIHYKKAAAMILPFLVVPHAAKMLH